MKSIVEPIATIDGGDERENSPAVPNVDDAQVPRVATTPLSAATGPLIGNWDWLFIPALVVALFLVYRPAWHGTLLWDDNAHVTKPSLRSVEGLRRIWIELGATQQYYPLLHSAFWLQYRIWGDDTTGFHLVNIGLHAAASVLALLVLHRLCVPGAYLAAAVFALHPVQVESVAWITEQKNTLSAVFYLGAMLSYLQFDRTRRRVWYGCSALLFVCGLFCKTVTATLPAALLVIFWWKRGRLSWKSDVLPLSPWLAVGIVAGLFTAWVERTLIGADGADFEFSFVERCLIAGRAVWFYLEKLVWPAELIFFYPRWEISETVRWQYLFPAAAAALLIGLWLLRRRTRAPLAALLLFGGTLFPALGFVNVYPFIFSFVADHFQYLACLPIIALGSAGAILGLRHLSGRGRVVGLVGCIGWPILLAGLSWRQCHAYTDDETLARATIAKNPDAWMAHFNLGYVLQVRGLTNEAMERFGRTLQLNPDYMPAQNNLALSLLHSGRPAEAVPYWSRLVEAEPEIADLHNNFGAALAGAGRPDEAMQRFNRALEINPALADAYNNRGSVLFAQGKLEEAVLNYRQAVAHRSDFDSAWVNLGKALVAAGQTDEAIEIFMSAYQRKPDDAQSLSNLASALAVAGRRDESIAYYRRAIRLQPDDVTLLQNLGTVLAESGQGDEAIAQYLRTAEVRPQDPAVRRELGRVLLSLGRTDEAIEQMQVALRMNANDPEAHNNLGAGLAQANRIDEAVLHWQAAVRLSPDYAEAHSNLGFAFSNGGKPREAAEHYRRAAELRPGDVTARVNLGTTLTELGELDDAIVHLSKAVELEPHHVSAHNNLGVALAQAGRTKEAIAEFEAALKISPDDRDAKNNLANLRGVR